MRSVSPETFERWKKKHHQTVAVIEQFAKPSKAGHYWTINYLQTRNGKTIRLEPNFLVNDFIDFGEIDIIWEGLIITFRKRSELKAFLKLAVNRLHRPPTPHVSRARALQVYATEIPKS